MTAEQQLAEMLVLVKAVRDAQKAYFINRNGFNLKASKALEYKLDQKVYQLSHNTPEQGELF